MNIPSLVKLKQFSTYKYVLWDMYGISVYASTHLREYLRNMNYESHAVHR